METVVDGVSIGEQVKGLTADSGVLEVEGIKMKAEQNWAFRK